MQLEVNATEDGTIATKAKKWGNNTLQQYDAVKTC
jgi:hypothetical protein